MLSLDDYILQHTAPEPDYLYRLWRAANVQLLHGRMSSGHLQGRLLKMLVQMIRPRNILEVGTFAGYSAICLAEGLKANAEMVSGAPTEPCGKVFTFEINDELEDFTRPWIAGSSVADYIEFIIGDALKLAPQLTAPIDMVFLDGDKRHYIEAYEMAMSLIPHGAYILADNTLWDSHVVDPQYLADQQTQGILRFNDHVVADARAEQVILPIRDGITLVRKR